MREKRKNAGKREEKPLLFNWLLTTNSKILIINGVWPGKAHYKLPAKICTLDV